MVDEKVCSAPNAFLAEKDAFTVGPCTNEHKPTLALRQKAIGKNGTYIMS
jgi:hypothetical protein